MNISRACVCSPVRFSSRKSFHGIDRSNGHATAKPINLQIRCKMNYWSRFRRRSQLMRFTTQNVRNGTRVFLFLSKRTIFVQFLVVNGIHDYLEGKKFSHLERQSCFNIYLLFPFNRFVLKDRYKKHAYFVTFSLARLFILSSFAYFRNKASRKIHFQLNFPFRYKS